MARLFFPNFSFEDSALRQGRLSARARYREQALAGVWQAVARAGDWILADHPARKGIIPSPASALPSLMWITAQSISPGMMDEVVPWGWTEGARRMAERLGCPVNAPAQEVVWKMNSRRYSFQQEQILGVSLPGSALISTLDELHSALHSDDAITASPSAAPQWLLKQEFSHAGRHQRRLPTGSLRPQDREWIGRCLDGEGILILEPWLNRVREFGIQWDIPQQSPPRLRGVTELLTDDRGVWIGSRVLASRGTISSDQDAEIGRAITDDEVQRIIRIQRSVVQAMQEAGYFGPVGIDAMIHSWNGERSLRPLQDINARWTMGRIACCFAERFNSLGMLILQAESPVSQAVRLYSPPAEGPYLPSLWWQPQPSNAAENR